MATINETLKIQVKDYLDTANLLDKKLNSDRQFYEQLKAKKRDNPSISFEEMQPDLEALTRRHQKGVLMMKDLESLMNRLTVLNSLAVIGEIDLELSEEDKATLDNVSKVTNLFFSSNKGEIVDLQTEVIEKFISETAEKYITESTLREQFNNL